MRPQNRVCLALGMVSISLILAACGRVSQETNQSSTTQAPGPVSNAPVSSAPVEAAPPAKEAESPPPESLRNSNIHFAAGSSQLTPQATEMLESVVTYLVNNPSARVKLSGFTDQSGPTALNEKLAEERVANAATFLEERSIDRSRIMTVATGEADPSLTPSGEDPATWNRRVEVELSLPPEG